MKKTNRAPTTAHSLSAFHRLLGLPQPAHPLISVVRCLEMSEESLEALSPFLNNFYIISLLKDFRGQLKYGQQHYDFEEGVMCFLAPGQLISTSATPPQLGFSVIFHPDFVLHSPLAGTLPQHGYFSYVAHEALHLSATEETMVVTLMQTIEQECHRAIDAFSHQVLVAQVDLLLSYCDRFYARQFLTRRHVNADLLGKLEALLTAYFDQENVAEIGLPTVQFISDQLHVSPTYLSDMLRSLTGQSTQQHIHAKLIDRAKQLLTTTSWPVGEIAYRLGFDYPQSFNKLFKKKMQVSPLAFRQSFN